MLVEERKNSLKFGANGGGRSIQMHREDLGVCGLEREASDQQPAQDWT